MPTGDEPARWVGEDELLLTDMEGVESARAAVAVGRAKRRKRARERRGQLERIWEVFGHGEARAYDDPRIRLLYRVIGDVHDQVWSEAVDDLRRQMLDDRGRELRSEMLGMQLPGRPGPVTLNDEALFLRDARAIARMTLSREQAMARADDYLRGKDLGMVAVEEHTYPNPYQDLWVVDPVDADPARRDELLDGGFLVVVPAAGEVYRAGGGGPFRATEMVGMIGPPDDEWDDLPSGPDDRLT